MLDAIASAEEDAMINGREEREGAKAGKVSEGFEFPALEPEWQKPLWQTSPVVSRHSSCDLAGS